MSDINEYNVCPVCGSDIDYDEDNDSNSDTFGCIVFWCDECGWESD